MGCTTSVVAVPVEGKPDVNDNTSSDNNAQDSQPGEPSPQLSRQLTTTAPMPTPTPVRVAPMPTVISVSRSNSNHAQPSSPRNIHSPRRTNTSHNGFVGEHHRKH